MAGVKGRSGRKFLFGKEVTKEMAQRIVGAGGLTPLEVLVNGMRITWERSCAEDHQGHNFLLALGCAEKAAPYMHARIGPIDEQSRMLASQQIRVVVQRLTKPVLLTSGEPELVDEVADAVIVEPVEEPQDRYREAGSQDAIPQEAAPQEAEYQETAVAEVDIKLLREKIRALRAAKAQAAKPKQAVRRARKKAA